MGAAHPANSTWAAGADGRHFNCTSVRYPINGPVPGFTAPNNPAGSGTQNDGGQNFPLSSGHSGGVNIALGDGSIRFFSNSTSLNIISFYCTRANGEVISN
jgi:prepilin-type processing-associated H-X9-DG protein